MSDFFTSFGPSPFNLDVGDAPIPPQKVSVRTLGHAIEEALMYYTRVALETVLADELDLDWQQAEPPTTAESKRTLIAAYITGWGVPQMASLARRIVTELDIPDVYLTELTGLLATYDAGGGVHGATKYLIFAANGPKPQIVLRDAMNNDIEIVENAEYCLVLEDPIPAEGLRFSRLVTWWREREQLADAVTDRQVALTLHDRLRASLESDAERVVFDTYATRYKESFDIPALVPQVYLHYDPYHQRARRASSGTSPLTRQRMDFLLLFSDRRRVVIEVDGKHHYAHNEKASPELYAKMVAEDRRLRLAGYEVYRFGGAELFRETSKSMVGEFFEELSARMS
ncbi:hypothetical protein [Gordonia cholesterolivorans]|uniref:AbiJ-NTD3 domain-containing protein n=1 Tax=Gordonia cholesterolivorans TaxID=559625 RepID=A0ABN3I4Z5_9ACTN